MTDTKREEIQRRDPVVAIEWGKDPWVEEWRPSADGAVVLYPDHLRHLKLAQIEVLEEVLTDCPEINDAGQLLTFDFIRTRIEEIRKELES